MRRRSVLPSFLIAALAPASALADEATAETVQQLGNLVRWGGVLTSLFVIAAAWVALKFLSNTVERLSRRFATSRMTLHKIETVLQFFLYTGTVVIVAMLSLRLDDRVLAVVGGTVAVALGFATKDLVASFIAGISIMLDRPFGVGDRVEFDGQYGDITAIGLRSVRMRTLDDNTVTIPNNRFLSEVTSCANYGSLDMQVGMNFLVGLDQDIERAREIVLEAALTSRYVFLPKPVGVLVTQVLEQSAPAVRLRLKAYVMDTKYEKLFETDVNLRVLTSFQEAGIAPPAILHRQPPG